MKHADKQRVTQGFNIVADGLVGVYNTHNHNRVIRSAPFQPFKLERNGQRDRRTEPRTESLDRE